METINDPRVRIDCKQGVIRAIRFNADGQYGLTCGTDRTIKLWKPTKSLELKCYRGHSADVNDCQANHDSSQFLSCSNDNSLISWDVESGKILRRLRDLTPLNSVTYGGPQSSLALAASRDGVVRIYDLKSFNAWDPIQTLTEADDAITCCRTLGHLIYTTSMDKRLRIYDVRKGSLNIIDLKEQLHHVCPSQDGSMLVVSTVRSKPLLIDSKTGKILNIFKGNENKLFKIESKFALGDSKVVSGSEDGRCYLWDIDARIDCDEVGGAGCKPRQAFQHSGISLPVIQTLSSDSLDFLLTACGTHLFLWAI